MIQAVFCSSLNSYNFDPKALESESRHVFHLGLLFEIFRDYLFSYHLKIAFVRYFILTLKFPDFLNFSVRGECFAPYSNDVFSSTSRKYKSNSQILKIFLNFPTEAGKNRRSNQLEAAPVLCTTSSKLSTWLLLGRLQNRCILLSDYFWKDLLLLEIS